VAAAVTHHYQHHPWVHDRKKQPPVRVADQLPEGNAFQRFNTRVGLRITTIVGTMICAYVFILLALYGLPTAIKAGPSGLVLWTSSEFLQLVLLPVIIVGQNVQAKAADKQALATYNDGEANLHEILAAQVHLLAQDDLIRETQSRILDAIAAAGERTGP
jgi:hypothetical protein